MNLFRQLPRIILAVCATALVFVGCDKIGDKTNGAAGWYFEGNAPLFPTESFVPMGEDYVLFSDDGEWNPYHVWVPSCYEGDGIHLIQHPLPVNPEFIQIVDDNSLIYYHGLVYKYGAPGASGRKLLYQFNNKYHGKMAVYEGYSTYFVYTRDGNNITVTYGDEKQIFTIVDGALMMNGGGKWTKYNPDTVY